MSCRQQACMPASAIRYWSIRSPWTSLDETVTSETDIFASSTCNLNINDHANMNESSWWWPCETLPMKMFPEVSLHEWYNSAGVWGHSPSTVL